MATGAYCGPHHICLRGYYVDAYTDPLVYEDDDFVEIHTSQPPGESILGNKYHGFVALGYMNLPAITTILRLVASCAKTTQNWIPFSA